MSKPKTDRPLDGRTYRVRQLPDYVDRYQAIQLLCKICEGLGPPKNIHMLSLAYTVGNFESRPTKTATVTFDVLPEILSDERTEWVLPSQSGGLRHNIVIDIHFLDFTVLYDGGSSHDHFDHPLGSWKQRGNNSRFVWLRDRLPEDFPSIRPILYGYDTRLPGSESFQNIQDLALSFAIRLKSLSRSSLSRKPMIFIAHSLGGIILKQTLLLLANGSDWDRSILSSVAMIIFFGVPSRGMAINHLLPLASGQPNADLVRFLTADSKSLTELEDQFCNIALLRNVRLISFYETQRSSTVQRSMSGTWSRSGPFEILVSRESATQRGSQALDIVPINEDHSNMVKFAEDDKDYQTVAHYISEVHCYGVQIRPSPARTGYSIGPDRRNLDPESPDACGQILKDKEREILLHRMVSSLKIPVNKSRYDSIEPAYSSTFEWVFNDPSISFYSWLCNGSGIYWISGKPGSGKSTLMKYLCDHEKVLNVVYTNSEQANRIFASFFFHDRGSRIQKSFDGLLRTILYQIVTQEPRLKDLALQAYQQYDESWPLEASELALKLILSQDICNIRICLFLDAIDEYDGSPQAMSDFLQSTVEDSRNSLTKLQVCFTSRPWNVFVDNFHHFPGLAIHEHTTKDIQNYIAGRISSKPTLRAILEEDIRVRAGLMTSALDEVVKKGNGVFLWIKLVLNELIEVATDGASPEELAIALSSLPSELTELYERTLHRIPEQYLADTYLMCELVLRAQRPLSLHDFAAAIECAKYNTLEKCRQDVVVRSFTNAQLEQFGRRLRSRCGGLLEVVNIGTGERDHGFVEFMHQTVKEFVSRPGFHQKVFRTSPRRMSGNGYSFLAKYLLALIHSFRRGLILDPETRQSPMDRLVFDCCKYASAAESTTGASQRQILDCLDDRQLREYFSRKASHRKRDDEARLYPINSILSFATVANLRLYMRERLTREDVINSNPQYSLLHCVAETSAARIWDDSEFHENFQDRYGLGVEAGLHEMVLLLLEHGADMNAQHNGMVPFQMLFMNRIRLKENERNHYWRNFAAERFADFFLITEAFLTHGQDPNVTIAHSLSTGKGSASGFYTALHASAGEMTKLLLRYGANVNSLDNFGRTPLDMCIIKNFEKGYEFGERGNIGAWETYTALVAAGGCRTEHSKEHLYAFQVYVDDYGDIESMAPVQDSSYVALTNDSKHQRYLQTLRLPWGRASPSPSNNSGHQTYQQTPKSPSRHSSTAVPADSEFQTHTQILRPVSRRSPADPIGEPQKETYPDPPTSSTKHTRKISDKIKTISKLWK